MSHPGREANSEAATSAIQPSFVSLFPAADTAAAVLLRSPIPVSAVRFCSPILADCLPLLSLLLGSIVRAHNFDSDRTGAKGGSGSIIEAL